MRDILAITTERIRASVKDRRVLWRRCVLWPVPVWLVALVAALIAQGLLVAVHEPAVPGHEVARVVDRERLVDVGDDEVIEAGLCASGEGAWGLCW